FPTVSPSHPGSAANLVRYVETSVEFGEESRNQSGGRRPMSLELTLATEADAEGIAAVRNAASEQLTATFGHGPWTVACSAKSVFSNLGWSRIFVVRRGTAPIATLKLGTKKPWAIDATYFSPCLRPLYLTSMAVLPIEQRRGVGRLCIEQAVRIARSWPADALRLDAYDAAAGAGAFYLKCGFREVGRASYRNTPMIYFERMI
ncbi:MAG: GNAT family N-acetyltransferase, partial [Isosphaeraceae bacterium]